MTIETAMKAEFVDPAPIEGEELYILLVRCKDGSWYPLGPYVSLHKASEQRSFQIAWETVTDVKILRVSGLPTSGESK